MNYDTYFQNAEIPHRLKMKQNAKFSHAKNAYFFLVKLLPVYSMIIVICMCRNY